MMRSDEILFWKYDWFAVVEAQMTQLRKHVDSLKSDFFSGSSLDELANQLADQFSLTPPVIAIDQIEVSQREVELDVSGDRDRYYSRLGPHCVKGTAIDVRLPFTGDQNMFFVKPSTFNYSPPRARVENGSVTFTITGTNLTPEKVKSEIDGVVSSINEFLEFQEKSLGNFPEEIHATAYQALEQRQEKLNADKDLVSNLGFRVRKVTA